MCCVYPVDRGSRICRNVRQTTERCKASDSSREKTKRLFCCLVLTVYLIFSDNKLRSFDRLLLMTQYTSTATAATVKCLVSIIPPDSCYVAVIPGTIMSIVVSFATLAPSVHVHRQQSSGMFAKLHPTSRSA
jgi:hypothetical protein